MNDKSRHSIRIASENAALSDLRLSWQTAEFSAENGIGPMGSLHEAGDALAAVAYSSPQGLTIMGSAVMVAPGLLLTATHVLEEIWSYSASPVFLTFLAAGTRAWLPCDVSTLSRPSRFDESRDVVSDLSLVSCTLNSEALEAFPLTLAPMQIALPLVGERLWAMGFRHQGIEHGDALITPMVSSGLVVAAYPNGRGERMISPCFEVDMETIGGMSGGAVVNSDGLLVGLVSSSWEGGPSYMTLIWDAVRLRVKGPIPKLRRNERVSLLGANAWGFAKLKGHVERDPFGDVRFKLSDEETKLLETSSSPEERVGVPASALTDDQLEEFLEIWGSDLEDAAVEGALRVLNRQSLPKVREFLEEPDIAFDCLAAIDSFSVEDFDGLEDITVTSTEQVDAENFRLHYYFDIPMLIWTIEMDASFATLNSARLDDWAINRQTAGDVATMEILQRRYFRGSAVFHRDAEVFTDSTITLSAMKPRRRPRAG